MNTQAFLNKNTFLDKPFRELINLNVQTLENLNYFNPTDLFNAKTPEDLMKNHVKLAIQNGHKTLDYLENVFQIIGRHWSQVGNNIKESTESTLKQTQRTATQQVKKTLSKSAKQIKAAASSPLQRKKTTSLRKTTKPKVQVSASAQRPH